MTTRPLKATASKQVPVKARVKRAAAEPTVRPGRRLPNQRSGPVDVEPVDVEPVAVEPVKRPARRAALKGTPGGWRIVNAVLALLLIGATVAAIVMTSRWQDQRQLEGYRQEALAAAKQAAVNFVSVS